MMSRLMEFRRAERGFAATEFALLLPAMLVMFLGTVEYTFLASAQSRLTWANQCIADVVGRYDGESLHTITQSQLQALGTTAVAMLEPNDRGDNIANDRLYLGAVMLVRHATLTKTVAQSTWPQNPSAPALVSAHTGTSSPTIAQAELTTTFTSAYGMTDSTSGVIYVAARYNYSSYFSFFFGSKTLSSDAYVKPRTGFNISYSAS